MKILWLDLETTGLDWNKHQILELAAVADDTDQPIGEAKTFQVLVWNDPLVIEPRLLEMHKELLAKITRENSVLPRELAGLLGDFVLSLGWDRHLNIGGKNVGFDINFLGRQEWFGRDGLALTFGGFRSRSRFIDIGMLWANWKTDEALPGTNQCLERAGLQGGTNHRALEDCLIAAELFRKGTK